MKVIKIGKYVLLFLLPLIGCTKGSFKNEDIRTKLKNDSIFDKFMECHTRLEIGMLQNRWNLDKRNSATFLPKLKRAGNNVDSIIYAFESEGVTHVKEYLMLTQIKLHSYSTLKKDYPSVFNLPADQLFELLYSLSPKYKNQIDEAQVD
ncbi:MAG: hypothetical protein H7Y13_00395 [Sphingobacteriaceae bacterium]|nr:hypothetical protein [Sphingobacteriaceae bacterium]